MHSHREGKLTRLTQSGRGSMAQTDRKEVEGIAVMRQLRQASVKPGKQKDLQDNGGHLRQIGRTIVRALKHLAGPVTTTLQMF